MILNILIATTFVVFNCDISATQMNAVQVGAGELFLESWARMVLRLELTSDHG